MNKRLEYVYTAIYVLNFASILFFSLVVYQTTMIICNDDQARDFLEVAKYLPHVPWQVLFYSIGSFILVGVSNRIKKTYSVRMPAAVFR